MPPALVPWAALLAIFPREVAMGIAPLVRRLNAVIGPPRNAFRSGGEPDGFDGLSQRGSYERLLLSEWLLAEEMPDEFVRRAAASEHNFLQIARREPAAARACVALFDAGPNQAGAPRLAQIAALIVLARRALAASTPFFWGFLQQPSDALLESITPQNVEVFLAARNAREAGVEELHAWKNRLHAQNDTRENASVWIAGGRRLRTLGLLEAFDNAPLSDEETRASTRVMMPASFLQLHDEVDVLPRVLATIYESGIAPREIALELPPSALQARLLRDPFGTASARKMHGTAPMLESNLIFSHSGQKLLARGANNAILAYPLPNSPRAGIGATKTHRAQSATRPFAANRFGRDLVTIGLVNRADKENALFVRVESGANSMLRFDDCAAPENLKIEENAALLRPCALLSDGATTLFFIDDARNLWGISNTGKTSQLSHQATDALAMTMSGGNIFYLARPSAHTRKWQIVRLTHGVDLAPRKVEDAFNGGSEQTIAGAPEVQVVIEDENLRAAFFGFGGELAHPDYGLVAYQREDSRWIVLYRDGALHLEAPTSTQVIGVTALPGKNALPALVVLEKDRRGIALLSRNWSQTLSLQDETAPHETEAATRATSPIVNARVSTQAPVVAYTTRPGEIVAYSLARETTLMRLQTANAGAPRDAE